MGTSSLIGKVMPLLYMFVIFCQGIDYVGGQVSTETTATSDTAPSSHIQPTSVESTPSVKDVSATTADKASTFSSTSQPNTAPSTRISSTNSVSQETTATGASKLPTDPTPSELPPVAEESQIEFTSTSSSGALEPSETGISRGSSQTFSSVTQSASSFPVPTAPVVEDSSSFKHGTSEESTSTPNDSQPVATQTSMTPGDAGPSFSSNSGQISVGATDSVVETATTDKTELVTGDMSTSTTNTSTIPSFSAVLGETDSSASPTIVLSAVFSEPFASQATDSSVAGMPSDTASDSWPELSSSEVPVSITATSSDSITVSETSSMIEAASSTVNEMPDASTAIEATASSSVDMLSSIITGSQSTVQEDNASAGISTESSSQSELFGSQSSNIEPSPTEMVSATLEMHTASSVSTEPSESVSGSILPELTSSVPNSASSPEFTPDMQPSFSSDMELQTQGFSQLSTTSESLSASFTSEPMVFNTVSLTEVPTTMTEGLESTFSPLGTSTPDSLSLSNMPAASSGTISPTPDSTSPEIEPTASDISSSVLVVSSIFTSVPSSSVGAMSTTTAEAPQPSTGTNSVAPSSSEEVIRPTPTSNPAIPSSTQTLPVTPPASSVLPSSTSGAVASPSKGGLSTGGKVAIGILVPLAIIGLIVLGVFFYRRYDMTHRSLKSFINNGVKYKTYTNASYKDDEVAIEGHGTWRTLGDDS